jgi:hypothetical protein
MLLPEVRSSNCEESLQSRDAEDYNPSPTLFTNFKVGRGLPTNPHGSPTALRRGVGWGLERGTSGALSGLSDGCDSRSRDGVELLTRLAKVAKELENRIGKCRRVDSIDHMLTAALIDDEVRLAKY